MTADRSTPERAPDPDHDYAGSFTREVRLERARTILIIVDMQYATASRSAGLGRVIAETRGEQLVRERFDRIERTVVPNLGRLLAFFRSEGLPVLYLTVGSDHPDFLDIPEYFRSAVRLANNRVGTREHEILDELRPRAGELVLRKTTQSGFTSTGLESTLRALDRTSLVFAGVSTNMCVDLTARDAADRGFSCVLVEDCCGAALTSYHDAAILSFTRLFGRAASSRAVMAELAAPASSTRQE